MRRVLTVLALAAATLSFAQEGGDERTEEATRRGRAAVELLLSARTSELWPLFDENMTELLKSEDNLAAMCTQIDTVFGAQRSLVREQVLDVGSVPTYVRTARFEKMDDVVRIVCSFDEAWKINGLNVAPAPKAAASKHLEYVTKTDLRLPFEGAWNVFWGGRELEDNYHAAFGDQRFAYDLLVLEEGKSFAGEGLRNEDHHCFGLPVLAPGAGKVVRVVDGIEDNVPGVMNPKAAAGNHVVIDHGNGEFSMLAHFKRGTIEAAVGDGVLAGDRLGLAGNSGNSSEPHIHYHLQTTPVWFQGEGLPTQFQNYLADGKPVERGEPRKGQVIANQ